MSVSFLLAFQMIDAQFQRLQICQSRVAQGQSDGLIIESGCPIHAQLAKMTGLPVARGASEA
ncbi:hypothetical protein [Pseudomonas capeferrum]